MEPVESLFRRESGRMVAALTRVFGPHNLTLVEDVVQDAFCRAMEVWQFRGMPDTPSAWLLTVAKNRALDAQLAPEAIKDDLLRMMFSCCDPRISEDSQVALVLHILCGFSVGEVAGAFVATHAAIRPSPVVALNRAIAVAQLEGPESGLNAIEAIEHLDRLAEYPFLPAALGELELRAGRPAPARRRAGTFATPVAWPETQPSAAT